MPLSWRLSGGAGLRPSPGSTLGQAGSHPTCRPSCLAVGSPLFGPGSGHLYLYTGTTTHHHGRWYPASGTFIPTCATRGTTVAQRLPTSLRTPRSARRLYCAASTGGPGWCARRHRAGTHRAVAVTLRVPWTYVLDERKCMVRSVPAICLCCLLLWVSTACAPKHTELLSEHGYRVSLDVSDPLIYLSPRRSGFPEAAILVVRVRDAQ